jgi:hypothetical protein
MIRFEDLNLKALGGYFSPKYLFPSRRYVGYREALGV